MITSTNTGVAAMIGIAFMAYSHHSLENWQVIIAPFGAVAMVLYGIPHNPFTPLLGVVAERSMSTVMAYLPVQYLGEFPWNDMVAIGLAVSAMEVTMTIQSWADTHHLDQPVKVNGSKAHG